MAERLVIDASYGEGGGQILRSALGLAAVTGRAVVLENIRARRKRPGLAAQHLTAVRALAAICDARLEGDALDSTLVLFAPRSEVRAGRYVFDIGAMREGGSAGSTVLVLQALVPALAQASGESVVTVTGGTHASQAPPFDYARDVWLHALRAMGLQAEMQLLRWGWYPAGQGEVQLRLAGLPAGAFRAVEFVQRKPLTRVFGRSVVTRLPVTIAQRMSERALAVLSEAGIEAEIEAEILGSVSVGAGIFLTAEYGELRAGFGALGRRGKPAEVVAEEAARALLAYHRAGAAADRHLGDQLVVPAALAAGPSRYSVESVSGHLTTCAWLVERFGLARVEVAARADGTGLVTVTPRR